MADSQKLSKKGSGVMGMSWAEQVTERGAPQGTNGETTAPSGTEQLQEPLSEQSKESTLTSTGRQRRKPLKYMDSAKDCDMDVQGPGRKSSQQKPPRKTPKRKAPEMDPDMNYDQEAEADPVARKPPKKTSAKKAPQKKKAAATSAEQETVKKTPKKRMAKMEEDALPADDTPAAPAFLEDQRETPEVPETTPGGRPRRGAAQAAMKYLHNLAQEVFNRPTSDMDRSPVPSPGSRPGSTRRGPRGRGKAQRRMAADYDTDNTEEDEDFVPGGREEEEEEEEAFEELDLDLEPKSKNPAARHSQVGNAVKFPGYAPNGLTNNIMKPIWDANNATKEFRDEHCNTWVFPEWIPAEKDWRVLSERESERFLPQEKQSPAFMVSREGISEEPSLNRLHRFESLPAHPERWDMLFCTGGPVWAMDWCPTPDGANACQYAAIYSHRGQDDQHCINKTYTEPGLIQVWDLGRLQYNSSPLSPPVLAYGLAQENGCVWILKWCPGGAWELPSTSRKAPLMPRLGLLAAATSSGQITIYSLPHPDSLLALRKHPPPGETGQAPLICQAEGVITLRVGSFKASHRERNGQVLSMDWLPITPHNILAAGFYDGMVCLWDLSSKSVLQRIRSPSRSFTLLPYHCFLAHDNATRALGFCHASSDLLVTGGDDRLVKMWDLRATYEPINSFKRFLSTELVWPLLWPGVFVSQENAYAPHGSQGLHYYEGGSMNCKPLFLVPRTGTLWSISMSDWLNTAVTSDTMGEVIMVLMPNLANNPVYIKRTIERRFPLYFTDMVLLDPPPVEEEMEGDGEEKSCGSTSNGLMEGDGEKSCGSTSNGLMEGDGEKSCGSTSNGLMEGDGDESCGSTSPGLAHEAQSFKKTALKYYLHYSDNDMRSLKNFSKQRPWKRMKNTEVKKVIDLDQLPLAALHKIRFNPNLSGQSWVVSGGQAGLVRVHCVRALNSPHISKLVQESQNQFNTMFSPDPSHSPPHADAVTHTTEPL